ncbi:hypothetical protein CLHUN_14650 [Ruminiclostridium hungatei]|uniref:Uncharacterized protein n=1 Tax=Ruminiclostridium hungatei TaxID=48256 RepID=A0A1V4SKQ5_RUMHU|nr:hypothetical protein CLHUN_14650 [Ruminiclostridium hungatei]
MRNRFIRGRNMIISIFSLLMLSDIILLIISLYLFKSINIKIFMYLLIKGAFLINMLRGIKWTRELSAGIFLMTAIYNFDINLFKANLTTVMFFQNSMLLLNFIAGLMLFFSPSIMEYFKVKKFDFSKK